MITFCEPLTSEKVTVCVELHNDIFINKYKVPFQYIIKHKLYSENNYIKEYVTITKKSF